MQLRKIRKVVDLLNQSDMRALEIRKGGTTVKLTRASGRPVEQPRETALPPASAVLSPAVLPHRPPDTCRPERLTIRSTRVGTLFHGSHDANRRLLLGQRVRRGEILCLLKAMKTVSEIRSEAAGIIEEVLLNDGMPVEYGQPICVIAMVEVPS